MELPIRAIHEQKARKHYLKHRQKLRADVFSSFSYRKGKEPLQSKVLLVLQLYQV